MKSAESLQTNESVSSCAAVLAAVRVIRGGGLPHDLMTGVESLSDRNERPPVQCRMPELPS